jgi:hypothetical protein
MLYNRTVRLRKIWLALEDIVHQRFWVDFRLIILTGVAIISKPALRMLRSFLGRKIDGIVIRVTAGRDGILADPPPGARENAIQ